MAKITVMFGNEPQGERSLDKPELKIGRAMDCDIVVDNLGVSRHHCSILQDGSEWVVADQGSNNGTFVGGQKVAKHVLKHQDRIVLGKHSLVFDAFGYAEANSTEKKTGGMGGEMTMFVDQAALAKMAKQQSEGAAVQRMSMVVKQGGRELTVPLIKDETVIGSGGAADLPAKGLFVKPVQAKVIKAGAGHRLFAAGGLRSVKVNGAKVTDAVLKTGDVITVGGATFIYKPA